MPACLPTVAALFTSPPTSNGLFDMATQKLFLLPGDGIGPEVMAEVEKLVGLLQQRGPRRDFEIENGLVGGCAYDAHGQAISDADMARGAGRRRGDARAPSAGPKWDDVPYEVRPEAGLLRLRKDLGALRQPAAGDLLPGAGRLPPR